MNMNNLMMMTIICQLNNTEGNLTIVGAKVKRKLCTQTIIAFLI